MAKTACLPLAGLEFSITAASILSTLSSERMCEKGQAAGRSIVPEHTNEGNMCFFV